MEMVHLASLFCQHDVASKVQTKSAIDIFLQNVCIFLLIPNPLSIQVLRKRGREAPPIHCACGREQKISIRADPQTAQRPSICH